MHAAPRPSLRLLLATVFAVAVAAAVPVFASSAAPQAAPAAASSSTAGHHGAAAGGYATTHFGKGNLPAGCILDRDESNPDNECHHMKVGLNGLDSPKINVAVLVPLSPTAERDMRVARQAVEMWDGGIDHLAEQMNLKWLADGVKFNVTTKLVPVDASGVPTQAINLVSPKIVVIATNPVGGIGIGIDPVDFTNEITSIMGISDELGAPCMSVTDPFNMASWEKRASYDGHHGKMGGIAVERCDGPGGNVCFSVNGSVDPAPGKTDFFSLYDLVAHETGHCLTLGHVGDGAEGVWGATPTNDIMAYSSDPVDIAKCVSTLDVEGFALQMSKYLDVNGDKKVDAKDELVPNDLDGDGMNSFQVQNPEDHWYASPTGRSQDCPQPDWSAAPIAPETNWKPAAVAMTKPKLDLGVTSRSGRIAWDATASWVSKQPAPKKRSTSIEDPRGDGTAPATDITLLKVATTPTAVTATIQVDKLWPTTDGGRATAYGLYVGGRKFDSFVTTQGASSEVQTIDSGGRHIMPKGTSTWDLAKSTVSFTIPRTYLAKQRIEAPYDVFGSTGVHIRTKDWVTSLDRAPATGMLQLAAAPMVGGPKDAPVAKRSSTRTVALKHSSGNTFTPSDTSTYGTPLVPQTGAIHYIGVPIKEQATAEVTLTWDDPFSDLGLVVKGGSAQVVKSGSGSVTVTVPWAHRDLTAWVIPSVIGSESVTYTLSAKLTTVTANADGDPVPDVADLCRTKKGPMTSGGCPDTDGDGILDSKDSCAKEAGRNAKGCPTAADERVVALLDGKQVSSTHAMTRHGRYDVSGSVAAARGSHTLTLVWYSGSKVIKTASRTIVVR